MWKLLYSMRIKILFILMIFLLLIPNVNALGTLQKKNYLEIKPGEIAEFTLLFWDTGPIEIELEERTIPENWIVIVEPKKFVLNENITSSEIVNLHDGYVNALPVKIIAIPPEDVNLGTYEITVNMIAGKSERGISFFQEKNFNFKVNILGSSIEQKENASYSDNKSTKITGNYEIPLKQTEKISQNYSRFIFWSIIIAVTILISWLVYKL